MVLLPQDLDKDGSGTLTLNELHRHLRCGVGMGKFTRRSQKDGAVVQRTEPQSRLRGSFIDQFLRTNPNAVPQILVDPDDRPMSRNIR